MAALNVVPCHFAGRRRRTVGAKFASRAAFGDVLRAFRGLKVDYKKHLHKALKLSIAFALIFQLRATAFDRDFEAVAGRALGYL